MTWRRSGATLVALLVGLTLTAALAAAAVGALDALQRTAHRQHERLQARAQLAQATAVLGAELRHLDDEPSAPEGRDLLALHDTAVELRAAVGGGALCAVRAGEAELPSGDGSDDVATWWHDAPRAGDVLLVHDEGPTVALTDDAWHARPVLAAARSASACGAPPWRAHVGPGTHWRLGIGGAPLPATVGLGAPARVVRRRRYALYRAGDAHWYLGQREWDGATSQLQPVAGPLASAGDGGLALEPTRNAAGRVTRLRVVVRAARRAGAWRWSDSAVTLVPLGPGVDP